MEPFLCPVWSKADSCSPFKFIFLGGAPVSFICVFLPKGDRLLVCLNFIYLMELHPVCITETVVNPTLLLVLSPSSIKSWPKEKLGLQCCRTVSLEAGNAFTSGFSLWSWWWLYPCIWAQIFVSYSSKQQNAASQVGEGSRRYLSCPDRPMRGFRGRVFVPARRLSELALWRGDRFKSKRLQ